MSAFKGSEAVVSADPVVQPKPSPIRSLPSWLHETISGGWENQAVPLIDRVRLPVAESKHSIARTAMGRP